MIKKYDNLFEDLIRIKRCYAYPNTRCWIQQTSNSDRFDKNATCFFASYLQDNELNFLVPTIKKVLKDTFGDKQYKLLRSYINCNPMRQPAEFHIDGNDYTVVYFPPSDYVYENNEGALEFENGIIFPYTINSAIVFDGNIKHKTLDHNNIQHRYTFAFKFDKY